MRFRQLALGALSALLWLPLSASAFVVTPSSASIDVGDPINFQIAGTVDNALFLTVVVEFDSRYLGSFAGRTTALIPDSVLPPPPDPLFGEEQIGDSIVRSMQLFDLEFVGFSFDGIFSEIDLTGLATGQTAVNFQISVCTIDSECDLPTGGLPYTQSVPVTIRSPNQVPEPATLWLAVAALVAGGLMFRKDSKSS